MRQEGAQAHHVKLKGFKKQNIIRYTFRRLPGQADHNSRAGLEAGFFKVLEAFQPVFKLSTGP